MSDVKEFAQPLGLRRVRLNPHVRDLVREHVPSYKQLIQPLFVVDKIKDREEVPGLSGTYRDTPTSILKQIESDVKAGVTKFILFPVPGEKHTHDFHYDFAVKQIAAIKKQFGKDIWLAVDVCLCASTEHGHCGVLNGAGDYVENLGSTAELAKQAIAFATAGADCVAPSDMMDGRILAIREGLAAANLEQTVLMSYSAKYQSKFYGPFRLAADSAPSKGVQLQDRATYQMDPANYLDALRSSERDAMEGADILMVKPGMPYLDVLYRLSAAIPLPWAVYQVSGEYASIELMAREGLMDRAAAHIEAWTAFKRAGASMILTYGARYAKQWLGQ